jgi:hypothetical protein
MSWDRVIDLGIIIFGGAAIWLVARPDTEPRRRWGYVCGLVSQPFWFRYGDQERAMGNFIDLLLVCLWLDSRRVVPLLKA